MGESARATEDREAEGIRAIAALLPTLVWTGDSEGRCDYVSQPWVDYTGVALEQHLGRGWLEAVHPADRPVLLPLWEAAVAGGTSYRCELRLRRHDGVYRWFDARAVPMRDAEGRVTRWFGTCTDVNEQSELRETLRRQSEQWARVMACSPGVICSFHLAPDGRMTMPFASPTVATLYGFDTATLAADFSTVLVRVHPADQARVQESIAESARTMQPWRCEFRYDHPQLGERWIEGHSAPVREPDGSLVWHGTVHDITERKRTEDALRAREALHHSVFSALFEGVMVFDRAGRVIMCNPSAERILRLDYEEMLRSRTTLPEWNAVREDGTPFPVDELPVARTLATGQPCRDVLLGNVSPDGVLAWLIVSAEPLVDVSGNLDAAVVSFTDVTSYKEAELALRRSEERFKRTFSCGPPGLVMRRGATDWEVVEVNDAFLTIGGWTRDELIGPAAGFVPREALPALLAAHESQTAVRDLELRFTPRGGPTRTLLASTEPLELAEGHSVLCFFQDITERQRAEAAVLASEARLRGIYEHAPVSIWYQDWSLVFARVDALRAEGVELAAHLEARPELLRELLRSVRTVDVNDRAVRLVGAAGKSELLGTPAWVVTNPEVPRVFKQALLVAAAGKRSFRTEMSARTLRGDVVHVLVALRFPPRDAEAAHVLLCITDITERRRMERRLATQAATGRVLGDSRSLEEAAPRLLRGLCEAEDWDFGAIWEVDRDAQLLVCVDVWHRPGLDAAELVARTRPLTFARGDGAPGRVWATHAPVFIPDIGADGDFRLADPARAAGLRCAMAFPLLAGEEVVGVIDFESCRERPADLSLAEPFAVVGRLIGSFVARVRAEAALQAAQQRVEIVASATNDVLWDWDLSTGKVWWSDGLPRLTGRPAVAGAGVAWWLEQIHEDDRARVVAKLEEAIAGDAPLWSDEYRFRRADGSFADVNDRGQLLRDAEGRAVRMIGGMVDVTVRKRAEAEVRRLADELEERVRQRTSELEGANHDLEAFSYSVSHDLRSPLRAVNGFAEMLMEDHGALLPPDGKRLLTTIRDSAARMGGLIDDLLMLSRLSRQPVRRVTVDVAVLVKDVLAELHGDRGMPRVEVRLGPLAPCSGDPGLLRQVWTNLLSNAMKYSSKSAAPVVETWSDQRDDETVYVVRDNGTGFDMRLAHKLFKVFQRLHRNDDYEGTGVGLAIVYRIVHRHGGRIWAEAAVDRGATFYFTLGRSEAS